MPDFFISYTSPDKGWAEWIAYVLEEDGFAVVLQAWDFSAGSNFVLEMQKAAATANRTIMVLSPDYLKSQFAAPEWAAAFSQDPQGMRRKLVPVMVKECDAGGLLKPLVHISLVGANEADARKRLIDGVREKRTKPSERPTFPGPASRHHPKSFPGANSVSELASSATPHYIPKVRRTATDAEKRRFVKQSFEMIKDYFQRAISELARSDSAIEGDFQPNTATEFTAEIFVNGKSESVCRVWLGGMLSSGGISYAEGRSTFGGNSCNEILSLENTDGQLFLASLMGMGFGPASKSYDLKHLTQDQAAEYLWRRFIAPLER